MSNAYVIEASDETAGVVVREGQRFRFLIRRHGSGLSTANTTAAQRRPSALLSRFWLCGPYVPNQYTPMLKFVPANLLSARPALPAQSATQSAGDLFIEGCFSG
jgi:hypothetical protein